MARRYELLVCKRKKWMNSRSILNFKPPKFGELVTVHDQMNILGVEHISIEEHCPGKVYYPLKHFRKPDFRELDHKFAGELLDDIYENRNFIR